MKTIKKWQGITENRVEMGIFDFSVIVVVGDYKTTCAFVNWKFEDKIDLEEYDMNYIPRGKCFFKQEIS